MPRTQPIATRARVRRLVKHWQRLWGLEDIRIAFHWKDSRAGKFCIANDRDTYCAVTPQPQYQRAHFYFDAYHDGWATEVDLADVIRHELGHVLVATLAQAATHCTDDAKKLKLLEDAEDYVVERLARMPCWRDLD